MYVCIYLRTHAYDHFPREKFICFHMTAMWPCDHVTMWPCGHVAMWSCGHVAVWL